jgi:hypothetical protein
MFSDSFFWVSHVPYVISIPFQDFSTIFTSCICSPSLQSWNRLDFRFPLSSRPRRRPRRSSSLPFLLLRCIDWCRASTLPHSPSSSRTHRRSFVPQPARYLTLPHISGHDRIRRRIASKIAEQDTQFNVRERKIWSCWKYTNRSARDDRKTLMFALLQTDSFKYIFVQKDETRATVPCRGLRT